jgi:lipopolysaccharide/colanic/teichoic acid biosynthesis glycosyltransferase
MKPAKRAFDLIASAAGLLVLSPLFVAVAAAVKIGDGGPVFFRQERVGRGGRVFRMWKFRTMVADADRDGVLLTIGADRRITPVGRVLRRVKLDELPQLFNVIAGNMSLVGPRPEVARYVALYTPEQRRVLELVPGITDPASLKYRDESRLLGEAADPEREYVHEVMPDKVRINLEYADRATVLGDVRLILATLLALLPRRIPASTSRHAAQSR